jgi:hypothetical protein
MLIILDGAKPRGDYGEGVEHEGLSHLLIVAGDEPYLLGTVRRTFAELSKVQVIRDRRRGERRMTPARPLERERRVGERRTFAVEGQLSRFGWVLIPLRQPVSV